VHDDGRGSSLASARYVIVQATFKKEATSMPSSDQLIEVATQIAKFMNAFGLAFKTYNISEFDEMIQAVAGEGQRITSHGTAEQFTTMLVDRGFVIFPGIGSATDGYVRVIRAGSLVSNLLTAFRYPGPNGDAELARLLRALRARRVAGDEEEEPATST
jgi:hypothetical protein